MKSAGLHVHVERSADFTTGGLLSPGKILDSPQIFFAASKLKLDQLFLHWLSLPESQVLVHNLIEDAQAGKPVKGPVPFATSTTPLSPTTSHSVFSTTPPLSPQKSRSPRSPLSPHRRSSGNSVLRKSKLGSIPQFYFPAGSPLPADQHSAFQHRLHPHFAGEREAGINLELFSALVGEVCDLPLILAHPLFTKLTEGSGKLLTRQAFSSWWVGKGMLNAPPTRKMFEVLRSGEKQHLTHEDFKPLLTAVLNYHPGLEFLQETPEFQTRYSDTVIHRIFYSLNRSGSGRLSYRELKRGDLLEALYMLEREEDINRALRYFSYEHFYVIYCKFWELDTDHDFHIDRNDLLRYNNCALTYKVVDRIFEQVPRKFKSQLPGKMAYEDFVWFILSEEDKSSDTAIEYWFKCVDIDCDGYIRPSEMWYFYEEQMKRLESMSQEPVHFEDVLCQLHDMLQPAQEGAYTLADLKAGRPQSMLLFNSLFNLPKFLAFENRDPFALRAEQMADETATTDWDRFARKEYMRLAVEDDAEDPMQVDVAADEAVWTAQLDTNMVEHLAS